MSDQMRTARRSKALFQAMSSDFLLREQFVTDPATIFYEYVHGKALPPETASAANHLLYAVFSNPEMLNSLRERTTVADRGIESKRDFSVGLTKAMGRHGDDNMAAALLRLGLTEGDSVSPALDLLSSIASLLHRAAGGASGTQATPGTGTQATPGTGTQATPSAGTQSTPGTGTQATPGTGTQSTPGTGTQATPGTGTRATPSAGTQATPGTGTQFTPGTGTQVSPPRFGDFDLIFRALIDYARQLRAAGALAAIEIH